MVSSHSQQTSIRYLGVFCHGIISYSDPGRVIILALLYRFHAVRSQWVNGHTLPIFCLWSIYLMDADTIHYSSSSCFGGLGCRTLWPANTFSMSHHCWGHGQWKWLLLLLSVTPCPVFSLLLLDASVIAHLLINAILVWLLWLASSYMYCF